MLMTRLPPDVQAHLYEFLTLREELCVARLVCRAWCFGIPVPPRRVLRVNCSKEFIAASEKEDGAVTSFQRSLLRHGNTLSTIRFLSTDDAWVMTSAWRDVTECVSRLRRLFVEEGHYVMTIDRVPATDTLEVLHVVQVPLGASGLLDLRQHQRLHTVDLHVPSDTQGKELAKTLPPSIVRLTVRRLRSHNKNWTAEVATAAELPNLAVLVYVHLCIGKPADFKAQQFYHGNVRVETHMEFYYFTRGS